MKVQDVLLKAMAKKITWWAAAEILGVTDRTMRRWRERLATDGYAGLADRRKGKPSVQRIPLATVATVLGLDRETYCDLNIRHFHEKLRDVFDLWVEAWRKKVRERLAKFGLELHAEKTRLIEFGRLAASNRKQRGERKPETFTFLGFTHYCGKRRSKWNLHRLAGNGKEADGGQAAST